MCMPSPPKLATPGETAGAQVGQNVNTAIANAFMNNTNQVGPNGTITNDVTDYYKLVDKSDPKNIQRYKVPMWTQTENLSPDQLAIKKQQDETKLGLSTLANDQTAFLQDYMKEPFKAGNFNYNAGDHEQWAGGLYDDLNGDRAAEQQQGLQSQLANSGIKLGSEAYNTAMESQGKTTEDARNQFMLDSYKTGFGTNLDEYKTNFTTDQANRNQPINEITALMSGGQVGTNQFGPTNNYTIPTVDQAGITANYDQMRMQQWQQQAAQRSSLFGGLLSFGSSMLSDERAKTDIDKVGETEVIGDDGKEHETGLFSYRYKGQPKSTPKTTGVMAQNLLKIKPSAVNKPKGGGLMSVHYDKLRKRG